MPPEVPSGVFVVRAIDELRWVPVRKDQLAMQNEKEAIFDLLLATEAMDDRATFAMHDLRGKKVLIDFRAPSARKCI